MRGSGIGSIHESVVYVLVVLPDSILEPRLLHMLSIPHLVSLASRTGCNICKIGLNLLLILVASNHMLLVFSILTLVVVLGCALHVCSIDIGHLLVG